MRGHPTIAMLALLASCSGHSTHEDTRTDPDVVSDPDAAVDPTPDSIDDTVDSSEEVDVLDDVDWERCPGPHVVEVDIEGPENTDFLGVSIEAEGTVSSISEGTAGRMTLDVDFSSADPELGTVTFTLPAWVADTSDISVDDTIHVTYHFRMWIWEVICLSISRDGETILAGAINDLSCPPIDDLETFFMNDLSFQSRASDCTPRIDDCASWRRNVLDISYPELTGTIQVLDGTVADIACGPGYRVALEEHTSYYREIDYCTDQPEGWFQLLVVRR